jgi:hypothetical protein
MYDDMSADRDKEDDHNNDWRDEYYSTEAMQKHHGGNEYIYPPGSASHEAHQKAQKNRSFTRDDGNNDAFLRGDNSREIGSKQSFLADKKLLSHGIKTKDFAYPEGHPQRYKTRRPDPSEAHDVDPKVVKKYTTGHT